MKHPIRNTIMAVGALLIVGSLGAYLATGMYPYTRFRDAEIEKANEQTDLADLFGETDDQASESPVVESVNAIGLLPSGPGMASLSVATLSVPGVLAIGGAWWFSRRRALRGKVAETASED